MPRNEDGSVAEQGLFNFTGFDEATRLIEEHPALWKFLGSRLKNHGILAGELAFSEEGGCSRFGLLLRAHLTANGSA